MSALLNLIMPDGSRHFGDAPMVLLWDDMRDHLQKLDGVVITGFVTDWVTEGWIDFDYKGFHFSANDQLGAYWLFVNDPRCPDDILLEVLARCEKQSGNGE